MQSTTISHEQMAELLEDNGILFEQGSYSSTTFYINYNGQEAVLINSAFENYFITQGE